LFVCDTVLVDGLEFDLKKYFTQRRKGFFIFLSVFARNLFISRKGAKVFLLFLASLRGIILKLVDDSCYSILD